VAWGLCDDRTKHDQCEQWGNQAAVGDRHGPVSAVLFLSGSRLIEQIPLATLIGVMFVVAESTFEWGSVQALHKIPRSDAMIVVAVTIVTVWWTIPR